MEISKRDFLAAGVTVGAGLAVSGGSAIAQSAGSKTPQNPEGLENVKICVFDTFGSVVDWRGSIIKDLGAWGKQNGVSADWAHLADSWRDKYGAQLDAVRTGKMPWTNLEALNMMSLKTTIKEEFPTLANLTPDQLQHVNYVWRRLDPWPDSIPGLTRLKTKFVIAPLSNGSVPQLLNMAKRSKLPWDNTFSCDLFKHYKPDPEAYLGVAALMEVKPEEIMMCAAHPDDLHNAQLCGLKTAYFPRPHEVAPGRYKVDDREKDYIKTFNVVATNIDNLATQMGCA